MSVPLNAENITLKIDMNDDKNNQKNHENVETGNKNLNFYSVYQYTQPKVEEVTKHIILLNFEDDTFRPVIKIDEKNIEIISKWYDNCKQIIDIEETNIRIPNTIKDYEIYTILFKNINCKHKDLFISSYVPEILNNITLRNKIRTMERQMSICNSHENSVVVIKKSPSLIDLNINIPKNMIYTEDYFYKKGNNTLVCPKYKKIAVKNEANEKVSSDSFSKFCKLNSDIEVLNAIQKEERKQNFGIPNIVPENAYGKDSCLVLTYNSCLIIDENSYSCYNAEYDILKPPFGSCSQQINEYLNVSNNGDSTKLIIVLINVIFLQTIVVINPDLLTIETIFENTEYGFIELFTFKTNNEDIETLIKKHFDSTIFNNVEEVNQILLSTSQLIELIKSQQTNTGPLLEEEKTVKNYFSTYFDISDDINNKMKASTLYDIVIKSQYVCKIDKTKITGFKNRLSNYLKDLGLQKKRYNDGYYYYGIVKKENFFISDRVFKYAKTIQDLKRERQMLIKHMEGKTFF